MASLSLSHIVVGLATILLIDVSFAQISPSDRDNASQSLWMQFQRRNILKNSGPPIKTQFLPNPRTSLERLLKPNYKPRFPFNFPNFDTEENSIAKQFTNGQLLGFLNADNFNDNFMSIVEPIGSKRNDSYYLSKTLNMLQKRKRKLFLQKTLKLSHLKGLKRTINKGFRRKLRNFLDLFSVCPVRYRWKDMGSKFWPRWIKEGSCVNLAESCSYPEGLLCHEYQHKNIAVLRFLCMSDWAKNKCKWYKIYIPFLLACRCGCNR